MRIGYLFLYGASVIASAVGIGACDSGSTVVNTNANVSNVRANSNTAILANANSNAGSSNSNRWSNANVSREDYDRNRADYERDKGESTIGSGANDSWLWFKTRAALLTTNDLRDSTINVDVVNDVVTLRGTVASAAQKSRAEQVAKGIDGVKSVKNDLKVAANDSVTNTGGNASNSNKR